jgi:DNA-binding MarR family transcriptional regulator
MEKYHLIGELKRINNQIKRKIDSDPVFIEQNKTTGSRGYVIGFIYRKTLLKEEVYERDIEKEFGIRRSTATQMLNSMESNGLIERISESSDKRLKRIVLTEKAKDFHKTICSELDKIDEELIGLLTEEEFTQLKRIIEKLKDGLKC